MRSDWPDYKTPWLAFYRALGVLVVAMIVLIACLALFRPSRWVGLGLFLALVAVGVGFGIATVANLMDEEARAAAAARARRREPRKPPPPPPPTSALFRLTVFGGGVLGLPLLIAGLIAHVAPLAVAGGAWFLFFLADTGIISPLRQVRSARRKT